MSIFDKLDNYYNSRKPNEVWLMVILFAAVVGYLFYTILEPMSTSYRNSQENQNKELTKKINSANRFLRGITVNGDKNFKVKELDKKIVQKRVSLNNYRSKMSKLDGAVKKLSNVLYNNSNWSKFLHGIATKAKDNNLKLYNISNTVYDQNSTFGKVLDVNIKAQGKYGEILSFMSDLEQTKLVSNISSVNLKATNKNPIADINLSIWGIKP